MDEFPPVRYARSDDGVHLAYMVLGHGAVDLVLVPGFVSHLEWWFDHPSVRRFTERLASFSRLILFDKRGTGLSDRTERIGDLDRRMLDVRAVMNAAGSERAVILGVSEGGAMAVLLAASEPERVSGLLLYGTWPRFSWAPDYPSGVTAEQLHSMAEFLGREWGSGAGLSAWAPSVRDDPAARRWWGRAQRLAASPAGGVAAAFANADADVRGVLAVISVPTLVLHAARDRVVPAAAGRYLAEHIPDARYVEIASADHLPFFDRADDILDETEEFVTGVRPTSQADRRLATVVVTDICRSTERLREMGDQRWHAMLDEHDRMVERQASRYGGRVVKTLGDGALLTFDGPTRAIRCAQAIRDGATAFGLDVRAGLHTGEVELRGDDLAGIAVHLASRVAARAGTSEVLASRTVVDLVAGSGIEFQDRGTHTLKGIEDAWQLFAAT